MRHAGNSCTWNAATRFSAGMLCQSIASMITADSEASAADAATASTSTLLLTCRTTAASFCRVGGADMLHILLQPPYHKVQRNRMATSRQFPAQRLTHPIVVLPIPDLCSI